MYTRCPSCSSTFRVTAAVLQMADGEVRCGSCGAVFNALHTLIDDGADLTIPGMPRLPDAPAAPQDVAGSPAPAPETLEFNVPETEWQRFFIAAEEDARARPDPALGDRFEAAAEPAPPVDEPAAGDAAALKADDTMNQPAPLRSLEEETADTDTWRAFLREVEAEAENDPELEFDTDAEADDEPLFVIGEETTGAGGVEILIRRPSPDPDAASAADGTEPDHEEPDEPDSSLAPAEAEEAVCDAPVEAGAAGPRPPETVLDWDGPPPFPERVQRPPAHTGRWLAASTAAALLLGAQVLHHYRDALAADANYGPAVRALYARLGWALYPAWPLEAYEMRDSKAIAEKSAPGALDIVAEIAVTGRQPVGLPIVRVVLRDRWSSPVASGVFMPAQYLAESQAQSRIYAPGSLIPVEISLKDPGSAAQGFEVDVCIPDRKLGLQCKAARDPFRH